MPSRSSIPRNGFHSHVHRRSRWPGWVRATWAAGTVRVSHAVRAGGSARPLAGRTETTGARGQNHSRSRCRTREDRSVSPCARIPVIAPPAHQCSHTTQSSWWRERRAMPVRIDPEIAVAVMRAAGLEPLAPYPGANVAWDCRCTKGAHRVAPTLTSVRTGSNSGCRYCGWTAAGERRRAAGRERAEVDMRAAGFEPLEPYPGARVRWRCRHTICGHIVYPRLFKIRAGGGGCLTCAGRAPVDPVAAEAQMRAIGMEPLEPFPGRVRDQWKCRCTRCGHIGTPTLNNIRRGQGGCFPCAHRTP